MARRLIWQLWNAATSMISDSLQRAQREVKSRR